MQIKTILTRLAASLLARSIRTQRRRLRDHLRREERLIARDTKRLRGLRLWIAWSGKKIVALPVQKSQGLAALLPTNQASLEQKLKEISENQSIAEKMALAGIKKYFGGTIRPKSGKRLLIPVGRAA